MKPIISIGLGALLVAFATQPSLYAQVSGYGAGGGMGGASGGGSFGSSGSSFGSSGSMFGSSGSTFGAASGSGFGNTGTTGGAANGLVGMSGGGMYGGTGSGIARAGGAGGSYSSSQYGNRGGQSSQYSQYGGAGGRGAQGGGRRGSTSQTSTGQPGQGGAGGLNAQQAWYEPRIEVGFMISTPAATSIQTSVIKPFQAPALAPRFGSVKASVQGSTVVLQGTVNSEEDRQLAAQMTMLEPAVFAVQNDIRVASPPANPPR
jgi:BON domain